MNTRSIIRFLETYERVSHQNNSGNNSNHSFLGDIMVSMMYSYFYNGEEEKLDNISSISSTLPFVAVSKVSFLEKECPICFEEYKEDQVKNKEIVITECGHLYHKKCIENWLEEKKNCPVCRCEFMI